MVTTLPSASPAQTATGRLAVALDFPDATAALACADQLAGSVSWFKVGLELYLSAGDSIVRELKRRGHSVFLDLKLHDIPNTAAAAIRSLARLEPDMLTIHAAGGRAMLNAVAEAARSLPHPPRLLAVTVLTSMDGNDLEKIGVRGTVEDTVVRLATIALANGCQGVVASAREASKLRADLGDGFAIVTPGVRPAGSAVGDQVRVVTPAEAIASGASYIVVGRPITEAADPAAEARAILGQIAQ